jgi:hypothetical protein
VWFFERFLNMDERQRRLQDFFLQCTNMRNETLEESLMRWNCFSILEKEEQSPDPAGDGNSTQDGGPGTGSLTDGQKPIQPGRPGGDLTPDPPEHPTA